MHDEWKQALEKSTAETAAPINQRSEDRGQKSDARTSPKITKSTVQSGEIEKD
jgi:hypothetical protein